MDDIKLLKLEYSKICEKINETKERIGLRCSPSSIGRMPQHILENDLYPRYLRQKREMQAIQKKITKYNRENPVNEKNIAYIRGVLFAYKDILKNIKDKDLCIFDENSKNILVDIIYQIDEKIKTCEEEYNLRAETAQGTAFIKDVS